VVNLKKHAHRAAPATQRSPSSWLGKIAGRFNCEESKAKLNQGGARSVVPRVMGEARSVVPRIYGESHAQSCPGLHALSCPSLWEGARSVVPRIYGESRARSYPGLRGESRSVVPRFMGGARSVVPQSSEPWCLGIRIPPAPKGLNYLKP